nr:proline iminopeptidase-family hydrolase [uncultured Halomonas sp.]
MQVKAIHLGFIIAMAVAASGHAETPLPDDGFVDVPGGRIAFRTFGEGDGTPLLVIHGGPGGTSCMYPSTLQGIAEDRPVITYDQLGSGNSDRMTNMEDQAVVPRFVDEVEAIRNELGLDEIHLAGHSWGGAVAIEYLLSAEPEGVQSVTFIGPLIGTDRWLKDANTLVSELSTSDQAAIETAIKSGDYSTPAFQTANDHFMAEFLSRGPQARNELPECANSPGGNSALYEYMWGPSEFVSTGTLQDFDRTDDLSQISVPTLFIAGEYDEARPATMKEFQKQVDGSVVKIIPDAGHLVNVDRPDEFNEAVSEFLSSTDK